jgi:hypothetical protein
MRARSPRARRKRTRIPRKQWALPAGIHRATGTQASLTQVIDRRVPTVSFPDLSKRRQAELVITRIRKQRRFDLWIMGASRARISKTRAIQEVAKRTPLGEALIRVEENLIRIVSAEARRRERERSR